MWILYRVNAKSFFSGGKCFPKIVDIFAHHRKAQSASSRGQCLHVAEATGMGVSVPVVACRHFGKLRKFRCGWFIVSEIWVGHVAECRKCAASRLESACSVMPWGRIVIRWYALCLEVNSGFLYKVSKTKRTPSLFLETVLLNLELKSFTQKSHW